MSDTLAFDGRSRPLIWPQVSRNTGRVVEVGGIGRKTRSQRVFTARPCLARDVGRTFPWVGQVWSGA